MPGTSWSSSDGDHRPGRPPRRDAPDADKADGTDDTIPGVTSTYLLVLGEREAIVWVLREQRMAFPATPRAEVARLAKGDQLFLYATRGAWHNPTRDRGRVIGRATVKSPVTAFDTPLEIAGMSFVSGCALRIDGLAPYPGGLELAPLVPSLDAFPNPTAWSIYLRRPLLQLSAKDAERLGQGLDPMLVSRTRALPSYEASLPAHLR